MCLLNKSAGIKSKFDNTQDRNKENAVEVWASVYDFLIELEIKEHTLSNKSFETSRGKGVDSVGPHRPFFCCHWSQPIVCCPSEKPCSGNSPFSPFVSLSYHLVSRPFSQAFSAALQQLILIKYKTTTPPGFHLHFLYRWTCTFSLPCSLLSLVPTLFFMKRTL